MKPEQKSYTQTKKVFDVARPGKTPASPSGRPVISNRKTVEDPDISADRSLMDSKQKIAINPDSDSTPDKPKTKEPVADPSAESAATPVKINMNKKAAEEKPQTTPVKAEPAATSTAPTSADKLSGADQPKTEQNTPAAPAKTIQNDHEPPSETQQTEPNKNRPAEPAHSEPMHMGMPKEFSAGGAVVSHHRKRRTLWLEILSILIILLLLAAIANLLLDAEIIKTNLNIPHTNFFDAV